MSDQHEPIRLRDARSGADPLLRQLLQATSQGVPSPTHKHALDEAILRRIEAQAELDGGTTADVSSKRKLRDIRWDAKQTLGKLVVIVGLAGTAWLGINLQSLRPEPSQPQGARGPAALTEGTNAPPASADTVKPAAAVSGAYSAAKPAESLAEDTLPARAPSQHAEPKQGSTLQSEVRQTAARPRPTRPEPQPAAREVRSVAANQGEGSSAPEQTNVAPELELLARAQRALRDDPAQAIELTNLHAKAYPTGAFSEEREAIGIEAMIATGQVSLAQERGRAFLSRHKSSAYAARVARLLQDH